MVIPLAGFAVLIDAGVMLRRVSAFLLVLACALAPAVPAAETLVVAKACCGAHCCCDHASVPCAPAMPARCASAALSVTIVMRETAPRPAAPAPRLLSVFVSCVSTATATRGPKPLLVASAASVPLFKEHCSFRI